MLFYINIPFKLIVSDALRIAIKHGCIVKKSILLFCHGVAEKSNLAGDLLREAETGGARADDTTRRRQAAIDRTCDAFQHWRQPRRGCRGHIPQYFGWGDVNENTPPQYYYVLSDIKVKVKFSHTRYRALGPELIPVYRQSARR